MKKTIIKAGLAVALSLLFAVCFVPTVSLAAGLDGDETYQADPQDIDDGTNGGYEQDARTDGDNKDIQENKQVQEEQKSREKLDDKDNKGEQQLDTASAFSNGRGIFAVGVTAMAAFVLGIAGSVLYRRRKK